MDLDETRVVVASAPERPLAAFPCSVFCFLCFVFFFPLRGMVVWGRGREAGN